MTTQLAVNGENDIYLDDLGNLAIAFDLDAALQGCQQAAQAQRGEMQYHVDRGVPNLRTLWSGAPSVAQFRAAVRRELQLCTDVIDVPRLDATLAGEAAVYTADIRTVFGTGVVTNGL